MLQIPGTAAYDQLTKNIRNRNVRIPDKTDAGHYDPWGGIFPPVQPKFHFEPGDDVFTIGSCFARNIEHLLLANGLKVPVAQFTLPEGELRHPAPHLLNEYNAGTIVQRLESAVGNFNFDSDMGIEETKEGFIDLFLHIHAAPVPLERLKQRRREIDDLYRKLPGSDVVIITLGLVECWFDTEHGCYLNRAPSKALVKENPERFEFHRLDVEDVVKRMGRAMEIIHDVGTRNVLLTVSPVPIEGTFMPDGAVVANSYSKAVLRVAAETLVRRFGFIDYFPSYEIATSFGARGYEPDNVHVLPEVVGKIVNFMIGHYRGSVQKSDTELQVEFRAALEGRNFELAQLVAEEMRRSFPDSWRTFDALGHVHSRKGEHRLALENARRALEIAGRSWGHVARVGRIYEDLGELDQAEKLLAEAVELPDGERARDWLRNVRAKLRIEG